MKKVFCLGCAAVAALALGLMAGCGGGLVSNGKFERYDDAALYAMGSSASSALVREIDVEWAAGSVVVTVDASATDITFTEDYDKKDACALHYLAAGGSLDIKYAASGADVSGLAGKTLNLTLPATLALDELDINTQSANITVRGVSGREFHVETRSGNVEFVLGDIAGFLCEYETRSGSLNDEYGTVLREKNTYLYGIGGMEIDVETVSGDLALRKA